MSGGTARSAFRIGNLPPPARVKIMSPENLEVPMPEQTAQGRIVETAREARGGERGPSMVVVLTVSTVCVAVIFMGLWYFMAL